MHTTLCKILIFVVWCSLLNASPFADLELNCGPYQRDLIPYVQCNENGQSDILAELFKRPRVSKGIHIGWSIEFNFQIIIARRPELAILCDINKRVFDFFTVFTYSLENSESLDNFLSLFKQLLEVQRLHLFYQHYRTLENALQSYMNWLTKESFQLLKEMYAEQRIIHLILDVTDHEGRFLKLAHWIDDHGFNVDTIYVSNISNWIRKKELFHANLLHLKGLQTLCIEASRGLKNKLPLTLRIREEAIPKNE